MPADGVRINVKRRSIRHVASRLVRNNCDVIAYLVILRVACLRIKRIAHRTFGAHVTPPSVLQE